MMPEKGDLELLQAACCIAGLDGEIHPQEQKLLMVLARKVGVETDAIQSMMELARTDPSYYQRQLEAVQADPIKAFNILTTLAIADGVLLPEERIVLRHMAQVMGLPDAHVDQVMAAAEKAVDDYGATEG